MSVLATQLVVHLCLASVRPRRPSQVPQQSVKANGVFVACV